MLIVSLSKTEKKVVNNIRKRQLQMNLTREGLAERSGASLPTLRKFQQKGLISLDSYLKLLSVVCGLEEIFDILKPKEQSFKSIDDVLKSGKKTIKK